MADIGTDHGFLPLYLLEKGISPKVIMTDISPYSLDKARKNFEKPSVLKRIAHEKAVYVQHLRLEEEQ